jgi:hypothetical protein
MSATTQVWVTLTASLGAAFGAAILTQVSAGRRETVRWERERQDRDVRWERERQDRREEDRRQQYANLIAVLDYWQSIVESLRADIRDFEDTDRDIEPGDVDWSELWHHRDTARQAMAIVDLVAPPEVRSLGHRAVEAGLTLSDNVRAADAASEFRERRTALNDAMRDDLGLPATAEVATCPFTGTSDLRRCAAEASC